MQADNAARIRDLTLECGRCGREAWVGGKIGDRCGSVCSGTFVKKSPAPVVAFGYRSVPLDGSQGPYDAASDPELVRCDGGDGWGCFIPHASCVCVKEGTPGMRRPEALRVGPPDPRTKWA